MGKKLIIVILALLSLQLFSENITISQIDSSSLLLNQKVNLYISVTDKNGNPVKNLTREMFHISESDDNRVFTDRKILDFNEKANLTKGINFFLMVDNSGSMYDSISGETVEEKEKTRIFHAKQAISNFLDSITNPADTVGLASFNTNYRNHSGSTQNVSEIGNLLDDIKKPSDEEAYTELYASLVMASDSMDSIRGRKVIIVLSDGQNWPYFLHSEKEHSEFGEKLYSYQESIDSLQKEGVSLFSINFGKNRDEFLETISLETGGAMFNALDEEELSNVYLEIKERILSEYLISYNATMTPADKKIVKVDFLEDDIERKNNSIRFYFSSTVMGLPIKLFNPMLLLLILPALLLWFILSRFKFSKINKEPNLEVLTTVFGKPSSTSVTLTKGKTIIGSNTNADLTIVGSKTIKNDHATITFDKTKQAYTIISNNDITVNNKTVKKKELEPGDVINVGGTTLVFDDTVMEKTVKRKKSGK